MTTKSPAKSSRIAVSPETFNYKGVRDRIPDLAALFMQPFGLSPKTQRERVADLLRRYDASDAADDLLTPLASGGIGEPSRWRVLQAVVAAHVAKFSEAALKAAAASDKKRRAAAVRNLDRAVKALGSAALVETIGETSAEGMADRVRQARDRVQASMDVPGGRPEEPAATIVAAVERHLRHLEEGQRADLASRLIADFLDVEKKPKAIRGDLRVQRHRKSARRKRIQT